MRHAVVRLVVAAGIVWGGRASAAPFAYIAEPGGNSIVARIDLATNEATSVPALAMSVGGTLDGTRAYAAYMFDDSVSVIDFTTAAVVGTIPLPSNSFPNGIAVTPDGAKVYVGLDGGVAVIDAATSTVTRVISMLGRPSDLIVNHAGTRAYVSKWDGITGSVGVINTTTDQLTADILVSSNSGMPWTAAISPDDTRMYVPVIDHPEVRVLDLATNLAVGTVSLCASGCGMPFGAAVGAAGDRLYVSLIDTAQVAVFDLPSGTELTRLPIAEQPAALDVTPDGTRLYVVNRSPTASLVIVDTASDATIGTVLLLTASPMTVGHFIVPGPTTTTTSTTMSSTTTSTTTPTVPGRGPAALQCQDAIAGSWKRYAPNAHRLLAACFHRLLAAAASGADAANAVATCRVTLDPSLPASSLARTRAKVRAQVLAACAAVLPADIGNPCAPAAITTAELTDCVLDAQLAIVARAAAAEYAGACSLGTVAGLANALPALCGP